MTSRPGCKGYWTRSRPCARATRRAKRRTDARPLEPSRERESLSLALFVCSPTFPVFKIIRASSFESELLMPRCLLALFMACLCVPLTLAHDLWLIPPEKAAPGGAVRIGAH